ncbi:MAG: hypothetical protein J6X60_09265, partial [Ruminiclostridium sp.]|nr:hypothetical protein [Ruminiclostridium sp.]
MKKKVLSVFLSICMIVSCMVGISITAGADGSVSFLDANGTMESCTTYTSVTYTTTVWSTGWYVVDSDTPISDRVTVTGDVNLILCDGKTLTVPSGINVEGTNKLTIYAQSTGSTMGALTATGTYNTAGIGGGISEAGGNITINGGVVEANGGWAGDGIGGGKGGADSNITINGGVVVANGGQFGAGIGGGASGGAGGTIKILGGQVTAIAGIEASAVGAGWHASGAGITLGWTNADGFIDARGTYKGTV